METELTEEGFERFHAETSRRLWAYLRRLTGDPSAADDVLQESYLRYLGKPAVVADERARSAYLFRIATHLVHDRWRRARRQQSWVEQLFRPPSGEDASGLAARWALGSGNPRNPTCRLEMELVFGQLKPRARALLWLAYVEGCSHHEIAEILDLKPASIRVLLFRARKRLAALLLQHGLGPETANLPAIETSP